MDDGEVPDHYYTHEGRLASFQSSQPVLGRKRGPKTLAWPHRGLDENAVSAIFRRTQEGRGGRTYNNHERPLTHSFGSLQERASTSNLLPTNPTMLCAIYVTRG